MNWPCEIEFEGADLVTPSFVFSAACIEDAAGRVAQIAGNAGCASLYSVKPLSMTEIIDLVKPHVEGFSVPSLFAGKLVRDTAGPDTGIHIVSPAYRPDEIDEIRRVCDFVTLNSLNQMQRWVNDGGSPVQYGLRVNPQLSFLDDDRYDPCRKHSKLGVPIGAAAGAWDENPGLFEGVSGLHIHTNCDSESFSPLLQTVERLHETIPRLLSQVAWVNLGGGYLFDQAIDARPLNEAVGLLKDIYSVDVFVEPGRAIVGEAGSLVSTVLDLFQSDGTTLAILDTSVNHLPEAFEYGYRPDVSGHVDGARHEYVLAGISCLAGDVFGRYAFEEPLEVGTRVVFEDVGAYSLVKSHMFNGINLPAVYLSTSDDHLRLIQQTGYEEFARLNGAMIIASS